MTKHVLISVFDKTELLPFAKTLTELNWRIISTGGTAQFLQEHGIAVIEIAAWTDHPEILGGRVKTLHPKIHGGLLFDRHDATHLADIERCGIEAIDMVVTNLYPFADAAVAKGLDAKQCVEWIDIGGPTMLRAAAKNWQHCLSICDPSDYAEVSSHLQNGGPTETLRRRLAAKVFAQISSYDAMIANQLRETGGDLPPALADLSPWHYIESLRYGENPEQQAAVFGRSPQPSFALKQGKPLSYNNWLDLDAAYDLVQDIAESCEGLTNSAVVGIIKHCNPCGVAIGDLSNGDLATCFDRALATDPKSSFGGIVATNRPLDKAFAERVSSIFVECIVAPAVTDEASEIFAKKPGLRIVILPLRSHDRAHSPQREQLVLRTLQCGLMLAQTQDRGISPPSQWQRKAEKSATHEQIRDLELGNIIAKHVRSNAIVLVRNGQTVGIGAGQMSRIDAAQNAYSKARENGLGAAGASLASDAFFPFDDTVRSAAENGVVAIVQPGGSKRDQDSINAATDLGLAMYFTGRRHFRH